MTVARRLPVLPWLSQVASRYLLPVWFAVWALWYVIGLTYNATWAFDAHLYYRGAEAWLAGADPWTATAITRFGGVYHFAGLPPVLLLYAPFTAMPEGIFSAVLIGASALAAIYIIRRLHLAWWWLLFPPLVQGVGSANPGILLLALLVWGHPIAEAGAAGLKIYAVIPMLARWRWRGLLVAAIAGLASLVLLWPLWVHYLGAGVATRLVGEAEGGAGATAAWWLLPPTLLAVIVIGWRDRDAAGWWAVPALWPSAQFHYAVMALPAMRLLPAVLLAIPVYGMPAVATMLYAWMLVCGAHHEG